ncbi:MAG: hypothetical protein OXC60_08240 [Litoreibacter sp.]|nr:hypothetical protein [Litoreibacter sp.]
MKHLTMLASLVWVTFQSGAVQAQDIRSVQDILDCVNARTARGLAEHEDFARTRDYYEPPYYFVSGPSAKYDTWGVILDMSKTPAQAYDSYNPKEDRVIPTFRRLVSKQVWQALHLCGVRRKWGFPGGVKPVRIYAPELTDTRMVASKQ